MIIEAKVIIYGFKFDKIDNRRIIKSVYLLDIEKSDCLEFYVSEDIDIDKEKLAKELVKYFRKDVDVLLDMQNDFKNPFSDRVYITFVGIKDENIKD